MCMGDTPRLGLAVTTFNRRDILLRSIAAWRQLTSIPLELVVCDDGSTDGTIEAVRALGIEVLGGVNRGIAWNKNRGLWYLANARRCDVIILSDDDVKPVLYGWEQEWIAAVARVGHVNFLPSNYFGALVLPDYPRAANLGVSYMVGGMILGQSAEALSFVGYMDPRFGRYGHEHSDFSGRFLRAGFGGFGVVQENGAVRPAFYVIGGGVELVPCKSTGSAEDLDKNSKLLGAFREDPIYRTPWRDDAEMRAFQAEVGASYLARLSPPVPFGSVFSPQDYLARNKDIANAGEPGLTHYLRFGHAERRKGGVVPPP